MSKKWREWTRENASRAWAAQCFLNMVTCEDCGLPWPEGLVHFECPGPAPVVRRRRGIMRMANW